MIKSFKAGILSVSHSSKWMRDSTQLIINTLISFQGNYWVNLSRRHKMLKLACFTTCWWHMYTNIQHWSERGEVRWGDVQSRIHLNSQRKMKCSLVFLQLPKHKFCLVWNVRFFSLEGQASQPHRLNLCDSV